MDFTTITQGFDLPIMHVLQGSDSLFLDRFIMVATCAATWIPLYVMLFYLIVKNNDNMKQISIVLLCAVLMIGFADYVVDVMVKPVFMRPRPGRDMLLKYSIDVVDNYRGGAYGFFSAHATNTMAIATFFSLLVRSSRFAIALYMWSLLNCYTRIYLGVHYPSDVCIGIVWGFMVGGMFYHLWRYINKKVTAKGKYISDKYTMTGYSYQDVNIVIMVLLGIITYAMMRSALSF